MKKIYNQPELEIIVLEEEVISTASFNVTYDPNGDLGNPDVDKWEW